LDLWWIFFHRRITIPRPLKDELLYLLEPHSASAKSCWTLIWNLMSSFMWRILTWDYNTLLGTFLSSRSIYQLIYVFFYCVNSVAAYRSIHTPSNFARQSHTIFQQPSLHSRYDLYYPRKPLELSVSELLLTYLQKRNMIICFSCLFPKGSIKNPWHNSTLLVALCSNLQITRLPSLEWGGGGGLICG
jgi:hypothetical protein